MGQVCVSGPLVAAEGTELQKEMEDIHFCACVVGVHGLLTHTASIDPLCKAIIDGIGALTHSKNHVRPNK